MAVSPARVTAFEILLRVEQKSSYAGELLNSPRYTALSPPDHNLATELTMGVLRWRLALDETIKRYSSVSLSKLDDEVLTALRIGTYQLEFLAKIPQRAAIHESVELVKRARKTSAAGLANAVLRKIAEQVAASQTPDVSRDLSHPAWMVERWTAAFGAEAAQRICRYDQQIPHPTIRVFDPTVLPEIERAGIELAPGAFLRSAYRIESGNFRKLAELNPSSAAIQDEGSQLVALLAGKGRRILDCCAAPGGKTRILARRNPDAEIAAVELHEHRAQLLRRLVPDSNVQVTTGDISAIELEQDFDCVLADVPCSGTGTLAHNPEIKWRLTKEDLPNLQTRQIAIAKAAAKNVAPGGRLVYSTCSLEGEENQDVVEQLVAADPRLRLRNCRAELESLIAENELLPVDLEPLTDGPYLRILPGALACDGFFAAIFSRE